MAKIVKLVTKTEAVVDRLSCDVCHAPSKNAAEWEDEWDGRSDGDAVTETTVECRTTYATSPTGGEGRSLRVDLCPRCFHDVVCAALTAAGATVKHEEYDW